MQQTDLCIWIGITILALVKTYVSCSSCTGSEHVGPSDVNTLSVFSPDTNDINTTTLFTSTLYTVPCCGVISRWEVASEGQGKIRAQVWRREVAGSNNFVFLGQNGWSKSSIGVVVESRTITSSAQVQVNTGDFIAIYHFNAAITRYSTCDPASDPACTRSVLYANDIPGSEINEGFTYMFGNVQSTVLGTSTVKQYAAKAYLATKSLVTCDDTLKDISDTLATGSHVINITTTNMDVYSSGSSFAIESISPYVPVTINAQTGQITTTGILTPSYPETFYDLIIRVTDVCSQTNTCNFTLVITNDPKPIEFANLPDSVETVQAPDVTIHIFTVQLSRQRDVDDVACIIQSHTPVISDMQFTIQNVSNTVYNIHMTTTSSFEETDGEAVVLTIYCWNQGLMYNIHMTTTSSFEESDEKAVVLSISCWNNQGFSNQSTLSVIFKPGSENDSKFLVIGLLLAVLVVSTAVIVAIILFKNKAQTARLTTNVRRNNPAQTTTSVIPKPIFIEPARTTFSNINNKTPRQQQQQQQQRQQHRGRVSPATSGYETSPNTSFGSETTPTSITSIGLVESPDDGIQGNKRLIVNMKKTETVFNFNSSSETPKFYFRKKPWIP